MAIIIGVTGGSGSGKSSVTQAIMNYFAGESIMHLEQDAYYKNQDHLEFSERLKTNYDHPFAFDHDLFYEHLLALQAGNSIDIPIYDYAMHTRSKEVNHQEAKEVIVVEGILVLDDPRIRDLMAIKIYVDTDDDIRLARRILRDINERGRSVESVIDQYIQVVKPMHHQFIEPCKRYADIIVPEGGSNQVAIDLLTTKISSLLNK
ncbi:uridine kinase [Hutsoniella sourekii]